MGLLFLPVSFFIFVDFCVNFFQRKTYQVREATIRQWVHMYIRKKKEVSLPPDSKPEVKMSRKKKASTESAEIKALKARISELELQNLALNTLIDVAERNGLEIRKKSGAKQ